MDQMKDHFDEWGLIVHRYRKTNECGDSAREWGTLACGVKLRDDLGLLAFQDLDPIEIKFKFAEALELYQTKDGFVRHPYSKNAWHRDPKDFSRDQTIGLLCGILPHCFKHSGQEILNFLKKFPPRFQNNDLLTWEWILFIRLFLSRLAYTTFSFLELGLVLNTILRIVVARINPDSVGDDINLTSLISINCGKNATLTTRLARWIYTFRPQPGIKVNGKWEYYTGHPIVNAWKHYYRFEASPPMDKLWEPIILKIF